MLYSSTIAFNYVFIHLVLKAVFNKFPDVRPIPCCFLSPGGPERLYLVAIIPSTPRYCLMATRRNPPD